jgi:hypothetical protein
MVRATMTNYLSPGVSFNSSIGIYQPESPKKKGISLSSDYRSTKSGVQKGFFRLGHMIL